MYSGDSCPSLSHQYDMYDYCTCSCVDWDIDACYTHTGQLRYEKRKFHVFSKCLYPWNHSRTVEVSKGDWWYLTPRDPSVQITAKACLGKSDIPWKYYIRKLLTSAAIHYAGALPTKASRIFKSWITTSHPNIISYNDNLLQMAWSREM